jgi:hypothetical protein
MNVKGIRNVILGANIFLIYEEQVQFLRHGDACSVKCPVLHAGFILGFFDLEDGGVVYLRNVC